MNYFNIPALTESARRNIQSYELLKDIDALHQAKQDILNIFYELETPKNHYGPATICTKCKNPTEKKRISKNPVCQKCQLKAKKH